MRYFCFSKGFIGGGQKTCKYVQFNAIWAHLGPYFKNVKNSKIGPQIGPFYYD